MPPFRFAGLLHAYTTTQAYLQQKFSGLLRRALALLPVGTQRALLRLVALTASWLRSLRPAEGEEGREGWVEDRALKVGD